MLIVAPLSILGVWEEEFQKFAAFPYALAVLSGSSAKKLDTLRHMTGTALQVVVVNYESAWRLEKALTVWHPDLIIADEGHKIKTHNIAASKAMHRMGAKASYRLLLTGTVITNKAIDVFSQYKFLNPAIYGNSFYAFRNRYFDMVGYGNYNFYVIIGRPSSTASRTSLVVPRILLTTSAVSFQIADESNYKAFNLSYSGSTVTLAMGNGAGQINRVFGIN